MNTSEKARAFRALGNQRRIEIIREIEQKSALNVSELAGVIRLSVRSTSRHLQLLASSGFVDGTRVAQEVYYRLNRTNPLLEKLMTEILER